MAVIVLVEVIVEKNYSNVDIYRNNLEVVGGSSIADYPNIDLYKKYLEISESGKIIRGNYFVPTWNDIQDKPDTFPPSSHIHRRYIRADIADDDQTLVLFYDE